MYPALILLALAQLIGATWLRWGGMHPDCGRELMVPKQILSGWSLYSDMRYLYGPLAPFFNAFLYRVFGVSSTTLIAAGMAAAALTALLVYALARRLMEAPWAAAVGLTFLYVLAFGNYHPVGTFNFLMPYTYAATYGVLLALASLHFLIRHVEDGGDGSLALSCLLLGLACLCKQEVGAAILGVHAASLLQSPPRPRRKRLAFFAAGLLAPACGYGWFLWKLGWPVLVSDNLFPLAAAASAWQRDVMGVSAPWRSLAAMLASLTCTGAFCLVVIRFQRWPAAVAGALWAAWALSADPLAGPLGLGAQYRGVPVLAGIVAVWSWKRPRAEAAFLISVFSLLLLARKILNCTAVQYGFFLLVPGLIVYYYTFLEFLPARFKAAAPLKTPAGRRALLAFFALLAFRHWQASAANYARRTLDMTTPYGKLRLPDDNNSRAYLQGIRMIAGRVPEGATLAAIPESLTLNFYAGRDATLPLEVFETSAFHGRFSVDNLLAMVSARPPDFLAIPYGPGEGFPPGSEPLAAFFARNYRAAGSVRSSEPRSPPMRIDLLKRGRSRGG